MRYDDAVSHVSSRAARDAVHHSDRLSSLLLTFGRGNSLGWRCAHVGLDMWGTRSMIPSSCYWSCGCSAVHIHRHVLLLALLALEQRHDVNSLFDLLSHESGSWQKSGRAEYEYRMLSSLQRTWRLIRRIVTPDSLFPNSIQQLFVAGRPTVVHFTGAKIPSR